MTRHGRNSTASAVYTYHERKKDTEASGYGTKKTRLGKDSIKDFDCCNLTLQPCKDPVITEDGYLYEREAILEFMLKTKRELSRQMKAYDEHIAKQHKKREADALEKQLTEIEKFVACESRVISHKTQPGSSSSKTVNSLMTSSVKVGANTSVKDNPNSCFWVPEISTKAVAKEDLLMKKPSSQVTCPMSGKPLKMKNLIDVKFTPANKNAASVGEQSTAKYMCALTNDALSNSTPCVVLRPSGQVITVEALDNLVQSDMMDPWKNVKLQDSDVILLQRGACGFAGSGVKLQAEKYAPSMSIS